MAEWIIGFVEQFGYLGIAALMALENIFPPLPSELIMPFGGFSAAQGTLSLAGVIAAGTCGSLLGALPWYFAGRWLGRDKLERWIERHGRGFTITQAEHARARRWFERHDARAVLLGRMVPAVRTVISVPAGVTRMAFGRFLFWSAIGSAAWSGLLALLGSTLGSHYKEVASWMNPVTTLIVVGVVVSYIYRVVSFKPDAER
ncbi:DedA family protein [Piscinibacter sakaiensis]|uniref:DedA family protein n=1 Tax=Piscinibacter sakaiensis TaxID=1547922 RepID=UPI003AAE3F7F